MKKRLIAIALIACFTPVVLPQNTRAQTGVWEIPCIASGLCIVIGSYVVAGITYYTLQNRRTRKTWDIDERNLQNHAYPQVQPGPRPGAFYAQEKHGAVNAGDCDKMAARFRRAGRRVRLVGRRRNNIGSGGVLQWVCVFEGEDAQPGWYGQ